MKSLNFHKWDGGSREATPILALHGFTGCASDFECFLENTLNRFTWWAPDLLGHGESSVSDDVDDYTEYAHVRYLNAIAEEIGKPFILLGYSMGARLALKYALERPELVSKLILVGGSPGIEDEEARSLRCASDEELAESIMEEGVAEFLKQWHAQPIIKTQEAIPEYCREQWLARRSQNKPLGLAYSLRGMGTGVMEPLWDRLGEIKCPVTLITGEKDVKFCEIAERMKALIAGSDHVVVPGVGHAAIWEDIDYFNSWLPSTVD